MSILGLDAAIAGVVAAITAETMVYRKLQEDAERQASAVDLVIAAENVLLSFAKPAVLADMAATGSLSYVHCLALLRRRLLVMEAGYQAQYQRDECLLIDVLLHGTAFDAVPLLWHIDGDERAERPSDAELQAGWEL